MSGVFVNCFVPVNVATWLHEQKCGGLCLDSAITTVHSDSTTSTVTLAYLNMHSFTFNHSEANCMQAHRLSPTTLKTTIDGHSQTYLALFGSIHRTARGQGSIIRPICLHTMLQPCIHQRNEYNPFHVSYLTTPFHFRFSVLKNESFKQRYQ